MSFIPKVLIIAGSDSGGGAGIQADIKAITYFKGYAMTAVTAITAQNTIGVQSIFPLPKEIEPNFPVWVCMSTIIFVFILFPGFAI